MTVPLIRSDADLDGALEAIRSLMEKEHLSAIEEARLDVMTALVELYEREHFPIGPPDPIEAIKFRLEQLGFETEREQSKALLSVLGSRARVYEVMHKSRALSAGMVKRLWQQFEIPLEVLLEGMFEGKNSSGKLSKPEVAPHTSRRPNGRKAGARRRTS